MRRTTLTITIISALLFGSCATTNFLSIDVMTPAAISFPPEVVNLVVLDNTGNQPADENHITVDFDGRIAKSAVSNDSVKKVFKEAFVQFMNEDKYFNKVELYPWATRTDSDYNRVALLMTGEIEDICKATDADALVSIDMFVTASNMELGKGAGPFSMGFNELKGIVGISGRIYNKSGRMLARPIAQIDSVFWNNIDNYIPHREDALLELALISAERFTKGFIPYWDKRERWYFSDNTSSMKNGAKLAKGGYWKDAALVWGEAYEKENNTTRKIKLASNIALANECLDDIENASNWIDIAFDLLPEKDGRELAIMVFSYKKQLDLRKSNISKLKDQLGNDEIESIEQ